MLTSYFDAKTGALYEFYGPYFWTHDGYGGPIRAVMYAPYHTTVHC